MIGVAGGVYAVVIHVGDDVAGLKAGLGGGRVGGDFRDYGSGFFVEAIFLGGVVIQVFQAQAQGGTAVGLVLAGGAGESIEIGGLVTEFDFYVLLFAVAENV